MWIRWWLFWTPVFFFGSSWSKTITFNFTQWPQKRCAVIIVYKYRCGYCKLATHWEYHWGYYYIWGSVQLLHALTVSFCRSSIRLPHGTLNGTLKCISHSGTAKTPTIYSHISRSEESGCVRYRIVQVLIIHAFLPRQLDTRNTHPNSSWPTA